MAHNTVARYDSQNQQAQVEIPLNPRRTPRHWQEIFRKYDLNNDGKISLVELRAMILSESYENDIPEHTVHEIMQRADRDQSGYLDMAEFEKLVTSKEFKSLMGHVLNMYVRSIVVPRRTDYDVVDGIMYDTEYSCNPPTYFIILISFTQIITYICDKNITDDSGESGLATNIFMYDPKRRSEIWRFITYMLVHDGTLHIVGNLLVQFILGIPLEMVHKWWRVLLIYIAGVLAGSLGTSITDPYVKLVGASGGVFALLTAHLASIILNWSEMRFAPLQLVLMLIWIGHEITVAVLRRYWPVHGDTIGYASHLAGALAGLLVGVNVLRNLRVSKWENIVCWIACILFGILMFIAIVWNIFLL